MINNIELSNNETPILSQKLSLSSLITPTPTPTKKPSLSGGVENSSNIKTNIIDVPELSIKNLELLSEIKAIQNTTIIEQLKIIENLNVIDKITLIALQKFDQNYVSNFNKNIPSIVNQGIIKAIFYIPDKFVNSNFTIVKLFSKYWKIDNTKIDTNFIQIEFGPFIHNQFEEIAIGFVSNKEVSNFLNNSKSIPQNRSDYYSLIYKTIANVTPEPTPTLTPTPTAINVTPTPTPTEIPQVTTKAKVFLPTPTPTPTLNNNIDNPSIITTIFLKSEKESVSPIIDTQRLSYTLIHNLINKLITQEEIDSELLPSGGIAKSKYILTPVKINSDILSSRFYISFSAIIPEETLLRIYYRVYNSIEDPSSFITNKSWTMIGTSGNRHSYGTEKIEFEYEVGEIEYSGNSALKEFDWFSIKIVKESSNESIIPKVSDFRVIALS